MVSEVRVGDTAQDDAQVTPEERRWQAQFILQVLRCGHTGWMGRKKEYVNLMQLDCMWEDWAPDVCIELLHRLAHGGGKDGWIAISVREWTRDSDMSEEDLAEARRHLREEGLIEEREPETGKKIVIRLNLDALEEAITTFYEP